MVVRLSMACISTLTLLRCYSTLNVTDSELLKTLLLQIFVSQDAQSLGVGLDFVGTEVTESLNVRLPSAGTRMDLTVCDARLTKN